MKKEINYRKNKRYNPGRFRSSISEPKWEEIRLFLLNPEYRVADALEKFPEVNRGMIATRNYQYWKIDLESRKKGRRLNKNRLFSDSQELKIVKLYIDGNTTNEIGILFNCNSTTIGRILKLNNVNLRKGGTQKGQMTGANHPQWKGGKTKTAEFIRLSPEYKEWRKLVFERDNYTCVFCGKRGVYLHADHIKPQCLFPELILEVSNGRTLCRDCHQKTPTYGSRVKSLTRQDFISGVKSSLLADGD